MKHYFWELLKTFIKDYQDKKIVRNLMRNGIYLIIIGASMPWWVPFIIAIINEEFHYLIPISNQLNYIVIGIGMLLIGLAFLYRFLTKRKNKQMIQIRHSSVEHVAYNSFLDDLSKYDVIPYIINQYKDLQEHTDFNIRAAWMKQDQVVEDLGVHVAESSNKEIAYLGMAHIPFQFLLGYQIADKTDIKFFEWNRTDKQWISLSTVSKPFPPLNLIAEEHYQELEEAKEIIIKVGITFPILDDQLEGQNFEMLNRYYLKLDSPEIDVMQTIQQLNSYKEIFRTLLTTIHNKYPKLKKVHLFIAAQPSIVFTFGSCISDRMDSTKEFWVYYFMGSSRVKYPWSIKIAKTLRAGEIKIV